jgi:hypothetical protein
VLQVLGQKDDPHASLADLPLDAVSITKRCREVPEEFPWAGQRVQC